MKEKWKTDPNNHIPPPDYDYTPLDQMDHPWLNGMIFAFIPYLLVFLIILGMMYLPSHPF